MTKDKLKIFENFQAVLHYEARGKPKKVVLWLSELIDPTTPIRLSYEHTDFKWLALNEACALLKYNDLQKALHDAEEYIRKIK